MDGIGARRLRAHRGGSRAAAGVVLGLCLLMAAPAAATREYILPTLFDVDGVAADDVLNIRDAPGTNGAIIGTLAPDARNIEVVGHDATGRWARINTGERSGWVALRYLSYQVDVWPPESLPQSLHCLGTEPFWSFHPDGHGLVFSTPEVPEAMMRIEAVLATGIFRDTRRVVAAQGDGQRLDAVLVPMACSDGMSDLAYGLDVTVVLQDGEARRLLTGCCSVDPG